MVTANEVLSRERTREEAVAEMKAILAQYGEETGLDIIFAAMEECRISTSRIDVVIKATRAKWKAGK